MDLMTMPLSTDLTSGPVCWPLFLLATKFSTAVDMAAEFKGKCERFYQKIMKDDYMFCAVTECYIFLKYISKFLIIGELEKRILVQQCSGFLSNSVKYHSDLGRLMQKS